jgi:hypothetical protein
MIAAKNIANRWYGKVAGIALVGLGIVLTSVPAPTGALHSLEDKAVHQLAPLMGRSEVGRQFLTMYEQRDNECHRSL